MEHHYQVQLRVFKNYSPQKLIDALIQMSFPNYAFFVDINRAYSDFVNKFSSIINAIAPQRRWSNSFSRTNLTDL